MRWILLVLLLGAWMRVPYEDAEVVTRSELIVVGHIKPGSMQLVPHTNTQGHGNSWEHHAILVITETIKGHASGTDIPIIIHYGLDPLVEGKLASAYETINLPGTFTTGSIQILDTGNSAQSFTPLVPDAATDNIWLLRKRSGLHGEDPGTVFGIVDPEDLRSLADKAYLALYLAADPEPAVRSYAAKHKEPRIERYLAHREIQRITALNDPTTRADKLMPYFLRRVYWSGRDEVTDALVATGVAGDRLLKLFPTANPPLRERIFEIWRRTKFKGAVPTLIALLENADHYWAAQQLTGDWWNTDVDSKLTQERRDRYSDVYDAVSVLAEVKDPRARPAIRLTLARWKAIKFDNPQLIEACEAALR